MDDEESLTKIVVDLPNHWAVGGESLWALPMGDDLFEVRNIPFYAYGLNVFDIVRAVPPGPGLKPEVQHVTEARGHRTLRVIFLGDRLSESERLATRTALRTLFSPNIPPSYWPGYSCRESYERDGSIGYVYVAEGLPFEEALRADALILFCPADSHRGLSEHAHAVTGDSFVCTKSNDEMIELLQHHVALGESGKIDYSDRAVEVMNENIRLRMP